MVNTITTIACDRCNKPLYDDDAIYNLRIGYETLDLCDKCFDRFIHFFNEAYLSPDFNEMFNINKKSMLIKTALIMGEQL